MSVQRWVVSASVGASLSLLACPAFADCSGLPSWSALRAALTSAVSAGNGGLGFNMWGTLIANDGTVCAVAHSGATVEDQWLGSRVISAQKANTANDFSLGNGNTPSTSLFPNGLALSTANLYSAVQPGGSLYGLQHSNPVDTEVAYSNAANQTGDAAFGTSNDPMVGHRIGGVNVFGGGLALYHGGVKVGAVGVSGDTSCTDHSVAWRVRNNLGLDQLGSVGGVSGDSARPDNIIYDITPNPDGGTGISKNGFGHPTCINTPDQTKLPPVH